MKRKYMKKIFGLFVIISLSLITYNSFSQTTAEQPISPDRPGVGTPPSLVPENHFQLETGFLYDRSHPDGTTTKVYSYNQSLFRFGVLSFAEIRLSTDYTKTEVKNSDGTASVTGFGPITLGTKIALLQEKRVIPQTSLMANFTLPKTGLADYRVNNVAPSVYLLFQNSLSDDVSLGYNIGLEWDDDSNQSTTFYAVNLGLRLTDKLSCFVENYGYFNPTSNDFYVDGGLAYLLTKKIQLDVSGGISTKGGNANTQINAGFSWLIP
jgi:hypothetical protein